MNNEVTKTTETAKSRKLEIWQQRLADSDRVYSDDVARMDAREQLFRGKRELTPLVQGDVNKKGGFKKTSHIRNIIFENIESQVSTVIPDAKVTARRQEDEHLAQKIERLLRNEKDRLPFETMNDMAERTVPIQGGVGYLIEWDDSKRTHTTTGELNVSVIHPKQFGPQPGVYTGIDDMDCFILKMPTTKAAIKRNYGVDLQNEAEAEPDIRSTGNEDHSDDAVTLYIGYEMNANGWIDKYTWVNDTELEDLENYQARRQPVCSHCGRVRPTTGQIINNRERAGKLLPDPQAGLVGGLIPEDIFQQKTAAEGIAGELAKGLFEPGEESGIAQIRQMPGEEPEIRYDGGPCPWCGTDKFEMQVMEYEQVILPITNANGVKVPGAIPGVDENGQPALKPTLIPFYKPNVYPVVLQKSVSVYGQLLGNSDVDAIEDQQNTTNRIEQKIIDRLMKAGTRISLPNKASLRTDPEDGERWYLETPAERQMIGVYEFTGNLQYELTYLAQVYEESRQILGITDSFQGRRDPTATSGKAKEYSAAMAAGRLESKRVMKNAAYADIYERMFKNWLAYSDEPRTISYKDAKGQTVYEEISRYDFLKQDSEGNWYWDDQFLFSVDNSATLAANREAMWQENRMNLQTGAFGDPTSTETLILFWTKMERDHYPGAGDTKMFLEQKLKREQEQAMAMARNQAPVQISGAPVPTQQVLSTVMNG